MIHAQFAPAGGAAPADLLRAARQILKRSQAEAAALTEKTRKDCAQSIRTLRSRVRSNARAEMERQLSTLRGEACLAAEKKYREIIAEAHHDCLALALGVTQELVGEILLRDRSALEKRIKRALDRLAEGRVLRIVVAPEERENINRKLTHRGTAFTIETDPAIASGNARVVTALGSVDISWRDEFEELATRLRSLLDAKLAHTAEKEEHHDITRATGG